MSDNNVCPICEAERDATGTIWHTVGCPEKPEYYYYQCTSIDVIEKSEYDKAQAEIARLKDALEKAHTEILHLTAANSHIAQERDEARTALEKAINERDEAQYIALQWENDSAAWEKITKEWEKTALIFLDQRDEARRWARYWYRAYNEDV